MEKKSYVMRVPEEYKVRLDQHAKHLAQAGIKMNHIDVQRNFAENAIFKYDDIGKVFRILDRKK